jgi:hypothetical protein
VAERQGRQRSELQRLPLDSNHARIALNEPVADNSTFPYSYAGAYAKNTGLSGQSVANVRNLSFDYLTGVSIGGGAPRFSVPIDTDNNGTTDEYVFMAAADCTQTLNSTWSRADFTGNTANYVAGVSGCVIYEGGATTYASNGTESAWDVFEDANPGYHIATDSPAFVIQDVQSSSFIDRVAFQNRMYTASGSSSQAIKTCPNEASC